MNQCVLHSSGESGHSLPRHSETLGEEKKLLGRQTLREKTTVLDYGAFKKSCPIAYSKLQCIMGQHYMQYNKKPNDDVMDTIINH